MRVAIAHDYLTQRGGAERVVLELARVFPDAPIHTSLYDPDGTFPEFRDLDVRPGPLDRFRALRADHRRALPLLPLAMSATSIDADVVVASSSGWAHGVRTTGAKVVYCHNPARWLYQRGEYLGETASRARRAGLAVLTPALKAWDRAAARSADRYLANSSVVRDRIRAVYGIDATAVGPPAGLRPDGPMRPPTSDDDVDAVFEDGFLLCVSRLQPYKNVDTIVEAVNAQPELRLVVAGDGPDYERLTLLAGDRVRLVGTVGDAELRWLYHHAALVVAASFEDYGLTPLEGVEFATPCVALRAGGFLDTVVEGETGVFFDRPEPARIADAVAVAKRTDWDPARLAAQAEAFGRDAFARTLTTIVAEVAGG